MKFVANLDIEVGRTGAHVRGDGAVLIVESTDPRALVSAVRRAAGAPTRAQLTTVADGLAARGVSIHVDGPRGRFVTVGADADSSAFGLLTGSRRLVPGWSAMVSSSWELIQRRRVAIVVTASAIAATVALRKDRSGRESRRTLARIPPRSVRALRSRLAHGVPGQDPVPRRSGPR